MKLIRIPTLAACVAITLTTFITLPALAAEPGKDAHSVKVPETVQAVVAEIHKHHGQIGDTVKAKNLKAVHEHSEAINALANALPGKVAAGQKARVEGTVKNLEKISNALHEAADANDQTKSEAQLKKLDAVLKQLDSQVK